MKFEWDEAKRKKNLRKHGIDFIDVSEMFENPMISYLDTRNDYDEDRIIGIGYVQNRILLVCYLELCSGNVIRIISARKALSHERKNFEQEIKNRLE